MRPLALALCALFLQVPPTQAQVSINIGFNLPAYPELQRVPGHPVYHAPQAGGNYFFHDGLFWVFQSDAWHSSSWYNGPWRRVGPERVPFQLLRVPVRYYPVPPPYFRGWGRDDAPRWGERWGQEWQQDHPGWNRRDRREVAVPAPPPRYQIKYPQSRYPHDADEQRNAQAREQFQRPDRGRDDKDGKNRGNNRNRRDEGPR